MTRAVVFIASSITVATIIIGPVVTYCWQAFSVVSKLMNGA